MANSIDGFSGNGAASIGTNRTSQQSTRDTSSSPTTNVASQADSSPSEVQITSTASQLASLGQTLSAMPAVDSDRVAKISASLADGSYSVSADKIASGLMQSDQALAQIGLPES